MTHDGPRDDGRRISDPLWELIAPLLPPRPRHPLGCHNPRLSDRLVLDAILLVLRTRCRWADLTRWGICSTMPVNRRFREWVDCGFLGTLRGLRHPELDLLAGMEWAAPRRRKRSQGLTV